MGLISELTLKYEDICREICNDYCKYNDVNIIRCIPEDEIERYKAAHCDDCPLVRL